MNILLINHYAGSPDMGMEFRPYYFAREWVREGHAVHIIAADYSHIRRKNPEVKRDWQIEKIDGIYYHWVKTGTYEGNGVKRAITLEQFVRKIITKAKELVKITEPDIIICSSTYMLDTYAGQALKKETGGKALLVHEVHDMWPATLTEVGGMKKTNPFVMAIQAAENSAYKHSDKIVAMMPFSKEYMMEHGMAQDKWIHIPLGIDMEEWEKVEPLTQDHQRIIQKLKDEGNFIVGYFGGFGIPKPMEVLVDAAAKTQERGENIRYVLVGDGGEKKKVMEKALDLGLKNVYFLPAIGKKEIPALLEYFDAIYIGTVISPLYRKFGVCLNKMADSMMSGKPIISAVDAPSTWVDEAGAGISTQAENWEEILEAIEKIKAMSPEERETMGLKGREYCKKNLDASILAREMLEAIQK